MDRIIKNGKLRATITRQLPGYAFLLPGFAFIAAFMGYPLFYSLYLSFMQYNFAFDPAPVFIGVKNFVDMFSDRMFMDAFRNTIVFSVIFFPVIMVLSLTIAIMLDRGIRGSGFFRTCIFLPVVIPLSLSGVIFQWILHRDYGLLNFFLADVLGLTWLSKDWLGSPSTAMFSIIFVSVWKFVGILVIFFMAGLQAIPGDLYEAATVDGASAWQRLIRITLPNLRESYVVCGIWAIIQSVKVFEQPFIMTNGGPGTSTLVLYQYTWINAFKHLEMGYASTIAYFMGVIILALSAINIWLNREND